MALLIKNLVFTVLVPGTVAVYLPWLIAGEPSEVSLWAWITALPILLLGASIYAWCVWDFATFGRGTPLPLDAPQKLVIRGLYRFSRNPMYVGVLTVVVGWALLFRDGALLAYAVFVFFLFHGFVVLYEERALRRSFGADYEAYCARVGRWLPRLGRATAAS
jgi:protein-S-isoprenylcysteine O-methyltransferase Ste14